MFLQGVSNGLVEKKMQAGKSYCRSMTFATTVRRNHVSQGRSDLKSK